MGLGKRNQYAVSKLEVIQSPQSRGPLRLIKWTTVEEGALLALSLASEDLPTIQLFALQASCIHVRT